MLFPPEVIKRRPTAEATHQQDEQNTKQAEANKKAKKETATAEAKAQGAKANNRTTNIMALFEGPGPFGFAGETDRLPGIGRIGRTGLVSGHREFQFSRHTEEPHGKWRTPCW